MGKYGQPQRPGRQEEQGTERGPHLMSSPLSDFLVTLLESFVLPSVYYPVTLASSGESVGKAETLPVLLRVLHLLPLIGRLSLEAEVPAVISAPFLAETPFPVQPAFPGGSLPRRAPFPVVSL